jgi:FHS family L-fucose permease-like MFS transporter
MKPSNTLFYALVSLFFMWALAHNLNPILIAKLRQSFMLSDTKAMLVDSAFYIAYFIMALPSAFLISKMGYQKTIILGLGLFAMGIFGFVPATLLHSYGFFLGALLLIGLGITMLEAAANPLITRISEPEQQVYRLNLAQSFNGLGAMVAAGLGGYLLLDETIPNSQMETTPFLVLVLIIICLMMIIFRLKFPIFQEVNQNVLGSSNGIFRKRAFTMSVVAQFLYVGSQIGVSSFFIRYMSQYFSHGMQESAYYLSLSLAFFTTGRFVGSWMMRKWAAEKILLFFSIGAVLCSLGIMVVNPFSQIFLLALPFFMSIMFPTIFALGIGSLQENKDRGGALIVMTISGGALIPFVMAEIASWSGSLSWAYFLPMLCFCVVGLFAFYYKRMLHE